jgi:ribosomal protein S18 acetylase RimI-like enzyme
MAIVPLNSSHAEVIATLHIQGIQTGFISTLGLEFVKEVYQRVAESESCFGFIEEEDNVVLGYVTFTANLTDLYKKVIFRKFHCFIPLLLGKIFSIKRLQNIHETLFYYRKVNKLNLPEAELLSIVVSETERGKGIARRLIQSMLKECKKRNIRELKVLVDASNKAANNLYIYNGFQISNQISSHGILSNIFVATLDKKAHVYTDNNIYRNVLSKQGKLTFSIKGIDWFQYNYFLLPAYLPHCTPIITGSDAEKALTYSKSFFTRWESEFGKTQEGLWWHVIRKGPWSLQDCSSNTRNQIRKGRKNCYATILSPATIKASGYTICKKACTRYKSRQFLPDATAFEKKIFCAEAYPENYQFFGVFFEKKLVAFSENYIQENAVLWESIWYDPDYLRYYSSYVLIDEMLDYYLNKLKMLYVSAGTRNIYHKTNVQAFMIDKFGFTKAYSLLHVNYKPFFKHLLNIITFLSPSVNLANTYFNSDLLRILKGLILQEKIRNSY